MQNIQRRTPTEQMFDGVYPAHPVQWCLISPNSDAIIDVEAFDINGNQLPFYTGTRAGKTILQSDGASNDGIYRLDFTTGEEGGNLYGITYHLLTSGGVVDPNLWVCKDAEIPGLPDGTVAIRVTLREPDSAGSGVTLVPYGWDLDSDGVIRSTRDGEVAVLAASDWALRHGLSAVTHDDALAVSNNLGRKLFTPGQSVLLGWGTKPNVEFEAEGDTLIDAVAINAAASQSFTLFAPRPMRLGYSVTAAGAGTLTSDLYAMQGPGGTVYDDSVVDSDVITFLGAGSKDVHWDVPAGMHSLKLSAATANMTSITIRVLPLE